MIPCQCQCGHNIYTAVKVTIKCRKCGTAVKCDGTSRKPSTKATKPKSEAWVSLVRLLRIPSDTGVGDTLQRQFAKLGGEQFKEWAAKLGIDCGCTRRQKHYNEKYPYS